ncbi:hypothetical protein ACPCDX_29125 [Streptomyces koyangensis]|uniref:hypothetical protein n=1 Tax=Streptomyces koyangensis TaxID=188770 RepID=UPI003C2AD5AF
MTPQDYLAAAEEHYREGRFAEATAAAALATAHSAINKTVPRQLHRGSHAPLPLVWCGTCNSPRQRVVMRRHGDNSTERVPCPRCDTKLADKARVRECRHCETNIMRSKENKWVDANDNVGCPLGPDPLNPPPPGESKDLNTDDEWAYYFSNIPALGEWTAEALMYERDSLPYMPVTPLAERPSPQQLEGWLLARTGRRHREWTPVAVSEVDGRPAWRILRESA